MYVTRLDPTFKDYVWGGNKLKEIYGKKTDYNKTAESWELSCHKDGLSFICDGKLKGKTLLSALEIWGIDALGKKAASFNFFPILIKLIDANDRLSVQVHPNDEYALKEEGQYGKTEMWYVIDAEPDAQLVYGLKRSLTKKEFLQNASDGSLTDDLNYVSVKKGDVFFIEAGLIHAIGKGILIAEIQQNSNLTYRVYDYGRKDSMGNTRVLHTEKASDVAKLDATVFQKTEPVIEKIGDAELSKLCSCPYFTVHKTILDGSYEILTDDSFISLTVTEGEGTVASLPVKAGATVFIPAGIKKTQINGKMTFLTATV
ncbi:MAG: manA [Clostridia bacterium]|jgi:mannose-6-phosphate isomerase|nr:manA [Clostridia bacterium]